MALLPAIKFAAKPHYSILNIMLIVINMYEIQFKKTSYETEMHSTISGQFYICRDSISVRQDMKDVPDFIKVL